LGRWWGSTTVGWTEKKCTWCMDMVCR
jgi:hypothetical protein